MREGCGGALLIRWTVPKRTCDSGDNYCDSADPAKSDLLHGKGQKRADYCWFALCRLRHDAANTLRYR